MTKYPNFFDLFRFGSDIKAVQKLTGHCPHSLLIVQFRCQRVNGDTHSCIEQTFLNKDVLTDEQDSQNPHGDGDRLELAGNSMTYHIGDDTN